MVIAELATGYSALTTAYEMAKGLKNIDDRVKLNAAVIDLQETILTAQQATAAARDTIRELEATIASYENWDAIADRYQLRDFGGGTFAYDLRADQANGEPQHRICANCYQKRQRSILQFRYRDSGQDHCKCHSCNSEFSFGHIRELDRSYRAADDWSPFDR
ncbi:hypothetical protein [Mesorhizobium sp.]|uniref:hypothetical protein n=1 Tax=Mesorhizobium sp. TaxID=1871066 RepID=UPI000FE69C4E|nr:MAG: hypothetical protein EOS33_14670 [Mesorhizobium sp.]